MRLREDTAEAVFKDAATTFYQEGVDRATEWFYHAGNFADLNRVTVQDISHSPALAAIYPFVHAGLRLPGAMIKHSPFLFMNLMSEPTFTRGVARTGIDAGIDLGVQGLAGALAIPGFQALILVESGRLLDILIARARPYNEPSEKEYRNMAMQCYQSGDMKGCDYFCEASLLTDPTPLRIFTFPLHCVSAGISTVKEIIFDFFFEVPVQTPAPATIKITANPTELKPQPLEPAAPTPGSNLISGAGFRVGNESGGNMNWFVYASTSNPVIGGLALIGFAIAETQLFENIKTSCRAQLISFSADPKTRKEIKYALDLLKLKSASEGEISAWNFSMLLCGQEGLLQQRQKNVARDLLAKRSFFPDDPGAQFSLEISAYAARHLPPQDFLKALDKWDILTDPYQTFRKRAKAKIEKYGYGTAKASKVIEKWRKRFPHDAAVYLHQAKQVGDNFDAAQSAIQKAYNIVSKEQRLEVTKAKLGLYLTRCESNSLDSRWEQELELTATKHKNEYGVGRSAQSILVDLHAKRGEFSSAIPYQENLTYRFHDVQVGEWYRLAYLYAHDQQPSQAEACLTQFFEKATTADNEVIKEAHFLRAAIADQRKDKQASINALGKVLVMDNKSLRAWQQLGTVYLQSEPRKALACFKHCVMLSPKDFDANLGIASAYYHSQAYPDALRALQICTELNPKDDRIILIKGLCHLQLSQKQQAKECLRQAEYLNPEGESCQQLKNCLRKAENKACVDSLMRIGFRVATTTHQLYLHRQLHNDISTFTAEVRNTPVYLPTSRYASHRAAVKTVEAEQTGNLIHINFF